MRLALPIVGLHMSGIWRPGVNPRMYPFSCPYASTNGSSIPILLGALTIKFAWLVPRYINVGQHDTPTRTLQPFTREGHVTGFPLHAGHLRGQVLAAVPWGRGSPEGAVQNRTQARPRAPGDPTTSLRRVGTNCTLLKAARVSVMGEPCVWQVRHRGRPGSTHHSRQHEGQQLTKFNCDAEAH